MNDLVYNKTYWITKYALTTGIFRADDCDLTEDGKFAVRRMPPRGMFQSFQIGKDAHVTEEAAKLRVRQVIVVKLKSLSKEIAKLEKLALSLT